MKEEDKTNNRGFQEDIPAPSMPPPAKSKLKKGQMSKAFESALDAVENIGKKKKH